MLIGSYDAHLYGLGAKDGKLAWKVQTEGYVHATPAVVDGIAYIAGCDEVLRAIRVADGKEMFTLSSGAYTGASPAIHNGHAYYGTYENEVLAVDLDGEEDRVAIQAPGAELSLLLVPGDLRRTALFVGGRDKMLHALDLKTGKSLWTVMTRARIDSSPVVSGGSVYVGSSDGKLYVVDAASGKTVFEFEAGGPLTASPAVADGKLVIGSADGKLFCLG